MQDEDTDDQLIARTALGERAAFDRIVQRHAPAIHRLARAMVGDEASAADVVQEALLAAYRSAATYRPTGASVRTWLFAIARNAARKARRWSREHPVAEDEASLLDLGVAAGWGADEVAARQEEHERLVRALAALGPEDGEVLLLDIEGMTGEETAQVLGLGLPAVKSRLHRARLRLMATMREGDRAVAGEQRQLGGVTCGEVLARLGAYVDGDLVASERARIDGHLRGCTVCERFGGRYASLVHVARVRLGVAPAIDEALVERIRRALAE